MVGVDVVDALDGFIHFFRSAESIVDRDPAKDENVSIQLDLSHRFRGQSAIRGVNLTRFQRAPEGSSKSACCGRDHIIERRRV